LQEDSSLNIQVLSLRSVTEVCTCNWSVTGGGARYRSITSGGARYRSVTGGGVRNRWLTDAQTSDGCTSTVTVRG
jgi:hypothetical protein